jgi:hypothetical protein
MWAGETFQTIKLKQKVKRVWFSHGGDYEEFLSRALFLVA